MLRLAAMHGAHASAGTISTPQSTTSTSARPMTGEEYIESIRDGREVYLYGDRIKDVTTHPAFRNSVRMTARLYNALHDPKTRDVLTCPRTPAMAAIRCGSSGLPARRRIWSPTATQSPLGRG